MHKSTWILDTLSILLSLGVIILLSMLLPQGGGETVYIQSREGEAKYPLSQDREIYVSGPLGESLIRIKDHKVVFLSSPCQGQDCVRHAPLGKGGSFCACLPNEVLVTIEGKEEVDDVTT